MGASVVLYRGIEKTINNQENNFEEKIDMIGDLFTQSGFMLPEDLMEDLYQFYLDPGRGERPFAPTDSNSLRNLGYHLVDVIDLFDMDYDNAKDSIKLDEWITIKDLVSSYAADIDDELLTYVMQFAIEKGAFRSS